MQGRFAHDYNSSFQTYDGWSLGRFRNRIGKLSLELRLVTAWKVVQGMDEFLYKGVLENCKSLSFGRFEDWELLEEQVL